MQSDINVTYLHNCCEYLKIYSSFLWKHYFVQDTYQITYGKKWTSESIYLKIHTDIINEPPLKSLRNRAHRNERRVQRAYKSRLRSKNTQTNLKRSASKRFGGVFFLRFCFQLKIHISSGQGEKANWFVRWYVTNICIFKRVAYALSIHLPPNKNINGELTIQQRKIRANLTSCTAKWIANTWTSCLPSVFFKLFARKSNILIGFSADKSFIL